MKKELLYKLVENGYAGVDVFAAYMPNFLQELRNENYYQMADDITNIMKNKTKIAKSSTRLDGALIKLPLEIENNIDLIIKGYKSNLIKHVMLEGRPGTGKTTFVKMMVSKIKVPFFEISLSSILDYKYGESIKHLEDIMKNYANSECIIFFDDADSLFRKRGSTNDVLEGDRILISMLKILDNNSKCLVFFATNLYKSIDRAIQRRMDLVINFDAYHLNDYISILKTYINEYGIESNDTNLSYIKNKIDNNLQIISPSDIKNLCKQIAIGQMTNTPFTMIVNKYFQNIENREIKIGK